MNEMIELHAEVDENGKLTIHDQHGRRLKGVRGASMVTKYNSATQLNIECWQYIEGQISADNKKYVRPDRRTPPPTVEYVKGGKV